MDAYNTFIYRYQNLRATNVFQWVNDGISSQWNISQSQEEKNYKTHKKKEWDFNACSKVKGTNLKVLKSYNSDYGTFWKRQT